MTMISSSELNLTQEQEAPKNGYKPKDDKKEQGITTTWLGSRRVRDIETGEVIELEYVEKKVSHKLKGGWRRVYLENFMEILTGLTASNRKIDVVEFILNNLNSENQLTLTQKQIVKKSGISKVTVNQTFKYLIDNKFMKKRGSVYEISVKFVCAYGSDKKNQKLLINFMNDDEQTLEGF